MEELKNGQKIISENVVNKIKNMEGSSNDLAYSFNEICTSIETLNEASSIQSQEIHTAATILQDFSDTMEKLAYNVTNVQIKVFDTDEVSTSGITSIEKLDTSLNELQSAFTTSSSTVNDLVGKLESVNTITDSISQIASQTNLLSLNAAIEAARAGEAGKGFSVVAGEVRKLAENSKHAVQSITRILDEIKSDILNASAAMNRGNEAISTQHSTLAETKNSFNTIKSSIDDAAAEITDCIENLANSSAQKEYVLTAVDKANALSQENTAIVKDITNNIENQAKNVQSLNSAFNSIVKELN